MIRIPHPSWRMVVATIAALVAALIYSVIQTSSDEAAKQQNIGQLLTTQQVLVQEVNSLITYTKHLADREQELLTYLRQHGITLPQRLITEILPPQLIRVPQVVRVPVPVPVPRSTVTAKASKSHGHASKRHHKGSKK